MTNERITELLIKHLEGRLTEADRNELYQWMDASPNNKMIADEFLDDEKLQSALRDLISKRTVWQRIETETRQGRVVPMKPRWIKWIAAASIILIIGIAAVVGVLTNNHNNNKPEVATKQNDVPAPSNTRAVITLANGTKVYLDSAGKGILAQENNVNVVRNENGIISYELNRQDVKAQGATAYNTLFNPRGSKVISLTLSDGTKVWLNSESSLRYPASFASAASREVEITGEAYFEVKHNAKHPFKVHLPNGSIVEDIGTSFNINSYSDEASIKTTLIEGSVKLSPAGGGGLGNTPNNKRPGVDKGVILKPGQQAIINQANPNISRIEVQTNVDIEQVMSWKNGYFHFTRADLPTIMRQLARWYDLEVSYEGTIPKKEFGGEMQRDLPLSSVLRLLEKGGVKFRIENKKLTVFP